MGANSVPGIVIGTLKTLFSSFIRVTSLQYFVSLFLWGWVLGILVPRFPFWNSPTHMVMVEIAPPPRMEAEETPAIPAEPTVACEWYVIHNRGLWTLSQWPKDVGPMGGHIHIDRWSLTTPLLLRGPSVVSAQPPGTFPNLTVFQTSLLASSTVWVSQVFPMNCSCG